MVPFPRRASEERGRRGGEVGGVPTEPGRGWGDAVRRDKGRGETERGGDEKSDGDGCAGVLDAVERRRGSEVKRGESGECSGFCGGDAH